MESTTHPPRSASFASPPPAPTLSQDHPIPPRGYGPPPASGQPLRRGSDGQQASSAYIRRQSSGPSFAGSGRPRHTPRMETMPAGETWTDFLRDTADPSGSGSAQRPSHSSDGTRRPRSESSKSFEHLARTYSVESASSNAGRKRVTSNVSEEGHGKRRSHGAPASTTPVTGTGTASNPIVISSPPQVPDRSPTEIRRHPSTTSSIVIPPWQPDQEVNECPVCGTPFTMFYRKHHCRKCGRVVCANCSPHRITIPKQFIVQPSPAVSGGPFWMWGAVSGDSQQVQSPQSPSGPPPLGRRSSSAIFGGEVVRVCNPCVPDPNFSPPPQIPLPSGFSGSTFPSFPSPTNLFSGVSAQPPPGPPGPPARPPPLITTFRPHLNPSQQQPGNIPPHQTSSPAATASTRERAPSQPPQYTPAPHHARQSSHPTSNVFPTGGVHVHRHSASTSSAYNLNAPLPPIPQEPPTVRRVRQIREEDECPVCGRELPPKGPNGDETLRERHVDDCIRLYSASSSSAPTPIPVTRQPPPGMPGAADAVASSSSATSVRPGQGPSTVGPHTAAAIAVAPPPEMLLPPQRPHQHRMLLYHATEKDCVGEDGERQECVICFEEFEEGDDMGRLDCLCKFHKACIRQWWATKGVGSCPTHQLHQ